MKISIITRHSVPNYGSLLQCYATERVYEKLGLDVEFINYTRYDERANQLVETLIKGKKWDKTFLTRIIYKAIQYINYKKEYETFSRFRKGFINESIEEYGNIEELRDNPPVADVYCSGSDQIWGPIGQSPYDEAYFLDFLDNKNAKRCISFSSSFGTEKLSKELKTNINNLLNKYSAILVREDSACRILKEQGLNDVAQIIDPTLFLTNDEWSRLIIRKPKESDYILVYQLHSNKQFEKYSKMVAKKLNKKLVRISPSIYHFIRGGKFKYLPDQFEFLSYFKNASFVLTDSFHGTVFSILFNRNFISVSPGKTSTRISSILKLLDLSDRMLKSFDDCSLLSESINYEIVNKKLEEEREKSLELVKKSLNVVTNNINNIGIKNNCCGCRLCENVCPKHAIKFVEDAEGFIYPKISEKECINCGLCLKKCPQANSFKLNEPIKVFACKNKNSDELMKGSSGSIFKVIANYFISEGGVVYGTGFDDNISAKFFRVTKSDDLNILMGSKYVQSNTLNSFKEVKKDLALNKKVLYIGTPCQIAGLKSFLNEKDCKNLLTIDIICHGVPSPKLFKRFKEFIEKKNNIKIKEFYFRSKEKNGWGMNTKIVGDNGKIIYNDNNNNAYYSSFLKGETYRMCCYNCKYATSSRVGDITLGDFWGIKKAHPNFDSTDGVSSVFINTKKGDSFFRKIEDNIIFTKSTFTKVATENEQLINPVHKPKKRLHIYDNLDIKDFEAFSKEDLKFKKLKKEVIKQLIPKKLKKKLKRLMGK